MFCGMGSISWNVSLIQTDCGEYSEILCRIMLVPQNTIMDVNNGMPVSMIPKQLY